MFRWSDDDPLHQTWVESVVQKCSFVVPKAVSIIKHEAAAGKDTGEAYRRRSVLALSKQSYSFYVPKSSVRCVNIEHTGPVERPYSNDD